MGNWRRVQIIGTCADSEVAALRKAIDPGQNYEHFHCLSNGSGICGVGDWVSGQMHCIGNLSERDYSPQDVVVVLQELVAVAPSLKLKVHCGADYESEQCIATITVDGVVTLGAAEIPTVPEMPSTQIQERALKALRLN